MAANYLAARQLPAGCLMARIIQRVHCPDRAHHLIKRPARLHSPGLPQKPLKVPCPQSSWNSNSVPTVARYPSVQQLVQFQIGRRPATRERHSDIQQHIGCQGILVTPHHHMNEMCVRIHT